MSIKFRPTDSGTPNSARPASAARLSSGEPSSRDREPLLAGGKAPGPPGKLLRSVSAALSSDRVSAFFLGFLVLNTILVPMFNLSQTGRLMLSLAFALTLILGALAIVGHKKVKYVIIGLTLSSLAVSLVAELTSARGLLILNTALKLACLLTLLIMTLARTLGPGSFTGSRVMGGIAGYLLIGFTWAFAYQLVIQQIPDAIHSEAGLSVTASEQTGPLIYYSFVTMTSVGYGDVRPVHPIARSLAVSEALVGQLYIAILMASLVGIGVEAMSARIAGHAQKSKQQIQSGSQGS